MRQNTIDPNDLLGAVKFQSRWHLFAGTIAEWILDYSTYDPDFDPSTSDVIFRNNLFTVDETNAHLFLDAMATYELSLSEVRQLLKSEGVSNRPLSVVVDFDGKNFINGFSDVLLHEYIPAHWTGKEDVPLNYVPDAIRKLWESP